MKKKHFYYFFILVLLLPKMWAQSVVLDKQNSQKTLLTIEKFKIFLSSLDSKEDKEVEDNLRKFFLDSIKFEEDKDNLRKIFLAIIEFEDNEEVENNLRKLADKRCEASLFFLFAWLRNEKINGFVLTLLKDRVDKDSQSKEKIWDIISNSQIILPEYVELLGKIKTDLAVGLLEDLIDNSKINHLALKALGDIANLEAEKILLSILEYEENEKLLSYTIVALGRAKSEQAIPYLIEFLEGPDKKISSRALWALQKITKKKFPHHYLLWKEWWESSLEELEELHNILEFGNKKEILATLKKLTKIKSSTSIPEIAFLLSHKKRAIRKAACSSLESFSDPAVVPAMIATLKGRRRAHFTYNSLKRITSWPLPNNYRLWDTWYKIINDSEQIFKSVTDEKVPLILRSMAIKELSIRGDSRIINSLIEILEFSNLDNLKQNRMRLKFYLSAIHCLRILKAEKAIPVLEDLLMTNNREIKTACQVALLQIEEN